MTLMVLAFRRSPDGKLVDVPADDDYPGNATLAGFESTRREFYAGDLAKRLSLKLLPQLETTDLYVSGADLASLQSEVELLLPFGEDGVVYIG